MMMKKQANLRFKNETNHANPMDEFLKKSTFSRSTLYRSIPEEDIVAIRGDSFVHVITPKNFPVWQDVEVKESDIDGPDHL